MKTKPVSRRSFLKASAGFVAATGFPTIVPSSVFGSTSPSNRINVGAIGTGRISRSHDMPNILKFDNARIMAVCDLDSTRVADAKVLVNDFYSKKTGKSYDGVTGYSDHRALLLNQDVDAVVISTPDHWHAMLAVDSARAGKDIYLQKPAALTIAEGRYLSNAVNASGRILQMGTQQRSMPSFRYAAELVRNGRIGEIKTVEVGLPIDPSGDAEPEMPVPMNLDYEQWLGSTPYVYYTEKRVHPQAGYDRPGWLRCDQFSAGMITGWGAHDVDIAHWGMNAEYTSPVEIWGTAEFPAHGLWNVHGKFKTEGVYANGIKMTISSEVPAGVRFNGTKGWIFISHSDVQATGSDPYSRVKGPKGLSASDPSLVTSTIGPDEIHLYSSDDQHGNWLECIKSRRQPITPVEVGHRVCSTCLLHSIAMKLKRKLYWDPVKERFKDDDEAQSMVSRAQRWPYVQA